MNKLWLLCVYGIFVSSSSWGFANAQTKCTQTSIVGCKDTLSETPVGVIDGKNNGFVLSRIPFSSDSVRLFLNHTELTQGSDFRVTGQNLTLFGSAVPKVGDEMFVLYQVQRVDQTPSMPTRSGSASQNRAILQAVLMESASNEPVPAVTEIKPHVLASTHSKEPPAVERGLNVRSLSLLARRIDKSQADRVFRSNKSGEQVSGFDGIGDLPVTSPYAVLLGAEPTDAAQLFKTPSGTSKRSLSSTPRSIAMLQRRFNAIAKAENETTTRQ